MIKIGNTYQRIICERSKSKKQILHVIAIDIYGRIFMEDATKTKSAVSFWEPESINENFKQIL